MVVTKDTQDYVEVLASPDFATRDTQDYVEALISPSYKMRSTQDYIELLIVPGVDPHYLRQIGVFVEIDFLNNGTWVDVTERVMFIDQLDRGKQHELDRMEAGTLALTLVNIDDAWDELNTHSPYYPNLKSGRPIRVRATSPVAAGLYRGKIQTFPPRWPEQASSTVSIEASDAFLDFQSAKIDRAGYDEAVAADGATHFWKCDEPASITDLTTHDSIGTFDLVSTTQYPPKFGLASLLFDMTGASVGFANTRSRLQTPHAMRDATFSYEFVVSALLDTRGYIITQGGVDAFGDVVETGVYYDGSGNQLTFVVTRPGGLFSNSTATLDLEDGRAHHVVCVHGATEDHIYIDGLDLAVPLTFHAGAPVAVGGSKFNVGNDQRQPGGLDRAFQGVVSRIAYYPFALGAAPIAKHAGLALNPWVGDKSGERVNRVLDLVGWPSGMRAIDVGQSEVCGLRQEDLGSSMLDYLQRIERSEGASLFINGDGDVVFRDRTYKPLHTSVLGYFGDDYAHDEIPFLPDGAHLSPDDLDLFNSATVTRVNGGVPQVWKNQASIDEFGERAVPGYDETYLVSDAECLSLAQWLVDRFSLPLVRVESMEFKVQDSFALAAPQAILRDIDDVVQIARHKMVGGGDAFVQACAVEGIEVQATPDEWYHTLRTNPQDVRPYWVLGTSLLGSGTRLSR